MWKLHLQVHSWSGSIEIGVTTCDPENVVFPTSATGFREGTWVLSGCSVMRDGHTVVDEYGQDLDQLCEGDRVGVLRITDGTLHLYVNGVDQGSAAAGIPSCVWAVVDMYGKCAQVTIVEDNVRQQGEKQWRIVLCSSFHFTLENVSQVLILKLLSAEFSVFWLLCANANFVSLFFLDVRV